MTLEYYADLISDDFQSTFFVLGPNKLQNMLGMFKNDFENLEEIVRKYIPQAKLKYTRLHWFSESDGPYDCYMIELDS
jgi:hypothetical protein